MSNVRTRAAAIIGPGTRAGLIIIKMGDANRLSPNPVIPCNKAPTEVVSMAAIPCEIFMGGIIAV
jgi:hypothetical protein